MMLCVAHQTLEQDHPSNLLFFVLYTIILSQQAHFNAPKFYTELKNNTVPRFLKVVSTSFGISIGLFCVIASLGFLTFGGNSSGLILNK